MDIKAILAKVAKGEALTDGEKAFLITYQVPDVDAVANQRAAAARKEAEKKLLDMQTKIDEMTGQLEEATAGKGTEVEKLTAQLVKVQKTVDGITKERDALKGDLAKQGRQHRIDGLLSGIKVVPGISQNVVRLAVENHLAGIEDLTNETEVTAAIAKFKDENKALLLADGGKGGAGTGAGAGAGGASGQAAAGRQWKRSEIANMKNDPKEWQKNRDDIIKASGEGRVVDG